MEFGTGAVKVTPAHDMTDSEIAERNKLPYIKIINEVGKIINVNDDYNGMKFMEAREKVVKTLTDLGLLKKEEEFTHNVAKCYRCASTVEPLLSKQWFLKMKPLAESVLNAIKDGKIKYYPDRWQKVATDWLENVRDWCISRQISWGHPIPIEGSTDTFDTWFSSALWPIATLGWPEQTKDFKEFYPTQVITSARDIIHLWISRMLFSGLEFVDEVPFNDIVVHATILTKDGKRMSKSLGTGIDPLEMIKKYGADATRFGLLYQSYENQEIRFNEDVLMMGKKFCNKLWNISRFVLTSVDKGIIDSYVNESQDIKAVTETDKNILEALEKTRKEVELNLKKYNFGNATHILYDFVWHDFADVYIEVSKNQMKDDGQKENTSKILIAVLIAILKMLHPFMPFVTEEVWQKINPNTLLIVEQWPK